jgi:C-methyltransferase
MSDEYSVVTGLATAHIGSRAIWVAASLGVADALGDQSLTSIEIAMRTQCDEPLLRRLLLLLVGVGIFSEANGKFLNNTASATLREDHPRSLRSFVCMNGALSSWRAFEGLLATVRTGRIVDPMAIWEMRRNDREMGRVFDDAMRRKALREVESILQAVDMGAFTTIADIGGGTGHLIRAIVSKCPQIKGILFDLPEVVENLAEGPHLSIHSGSFFVDPLPSADLYILMNILHDWPDREATTILQAVRNAARGDSQIMIVEMVLPDDSSMSRARVLDIVMMGVTGGRERTFSEYAALASSAGFSAPGRIDLPTGFSIMTYLCK